MAPTIENYAASIEVSASPEDCFDAVTKKMSQWWTETTEGKLNKVGNRVKVMFPPHFGYWIFEATVLDRGSMVEMICVDAHHKVEGQPKEIDQEWLGTRIVWEFTPSGEKTRVKIIHHGLTPQLNCWDNCQDGWNYFVKGSLKNFLNGSAASPHKAV